MLLQNKRRLEALLRSLLQHQGPLPDEAPGPQGAAAAAAATATAGGQQGGAAARAAAGRQGQGQMRGQIQRVGNG